MTTLGSNRLCRGSWSLRPQGAHLALGLTVTVATILLLIAYVQVYWISQAELVSEVLRFARVPHELFLPVVGAKFLHAIPPEFVMDKAQFTEAVSLTAIIVLFLAILILALLRRLNPPFRVLAIFLLANAIVNLAYGILHPEQPALLQVDWLTSGVVIIPLIALMFSTLVFPIPGPLSTKLAGLLGCLVFSIVWSTLRLSLALASLFYLGTFSFMFLEYVPGAFVDFIYILLFYSLTMRRLAPPADTSQVEGTS